MPKACAQAVYKLGVSCGHNNPLTHRTLSRGGAMGTIGCFVHQLYPGKQQFFPHVFYGFLPLLFDGLYTVYTDLTKTTTKYLYR